MHEGFVDVMGPIFGTNIAIMNVRGQGNVPEAEERSC